MAPSCPGHLPDVDRAVKSGDPDAMGRGEVEAFPARAVAALAAAPTVVLLVVARRYGWHRDELYFLEAGKHLALGYVDQPPFTPLVARIADAIAPGNLVVLRAPSAIATGAAVVLAALIARELGAAARGQVLAAGAMAAGGFTLGVGHLLSTATFDHLAWLVLLWLAARVLRTEDPRWWIAFGTVAGLAMWNKDLVPLLAFALVAGLAIDRRWGLLITWWLPAGALAALVVASPTLLWQATHDWPQLEMARVLSDRLAVENRTTLVPLQLLFVGPFLIVFLWRGARWLRSDAVARPFRPLLWAWPVAVVTALITAGRPYYVLPLTTTVLLAGIVAFDLSGAPTMRAARLVVLNAVASAPLALPLLPISALDGPLAAPNEAVLETVGWPELADQVADVVADLPADERARAIVVTLTYGEAGAIDRFGPARGLGPAYSPHNSYWDLRRPPDDDATVVAVRFNLTYLSRMFDDCRTVAEVDNGVDVPNEVQGQPIVVCRGLHGSWTDVWPEMRFLS
jgi:hypothetical protein